MRKTGLTITMLALLVGYVSAEDEKITIGAGNTVGLYYASGSAVAKLFNLKRQEYGQWVVTRASNGSVENINHVLEGTVDFGMAQATVLDKAVRGIGPWEGVPHKNLQAVLTLYTEKLTIVAAEDAEIYTLADLKGKRVSIGAPGSSDASYVRDLLLLDGIRSSELTLLEKSASRDADLLEEGKIDAYFFTVGHPAFSVREASSGKRRLRLVPLSEPLIEHCILENPLLKSVLIQTDYYPGLANDEPVRTLGDSAVLFTQQDMPEETVYRMVKEVMSNLDLFRRQQPVLKNLKAGEMGVVSAIPLHPGAKRYFMEAGLLP